MPSGDNVFSFDQEPLPTAEELKEAILEAEEEHSQAVSALDLSYDVLMPSANFKVLFSLHVFTRCFLIPSLPSLSCALILLPLFLYFLPPPVLLTLYCCLCSHSSCPLSPPSLLSYLLSPSNPTSVSSNPSQKLELHRTSLHDRKRLSYELTSKCASRLLFLGQVGYHAHTHSRDVSK